MKNIKSKILIIDDEQEVLSTCTKMLTVLGFDVTSTPDSGLAIEMLAGSDYDLILCDLLMPGLDGMQLLKKVRELNKNIPVIIFSAYGTVDRAVACMKAGAFDFIEKPFESDHLKIVIDKALSYSSLYNERNNLLKQLEGKYKFENIIGKSPAILKVFEMVESISESEANVLITGESGTGKELIARSIHARSKRKTQPFIPVNCGAFPENLFEAELFGYEKGAFTNASQKKSGLLEFANTGTFFLDEVCELPYNLQTKLLRVLQNKELRRLGGNELIQVDVRWISATNRNVDDNLKKNLLRDDFYYRLNVINIHLPPLRDRKDDIKLIAEHFLKNSSKTINKEIQNISDDVMDVLYNYNWPGNVRELENVIERAVAFCKSDKLELSDLPEMFQSKNTNTKFSFQNLSLQQAKQKAAADAEKEFLIFLLEKHKGNITNISKEAGMTRRNTYLLLNKYQLDPLDWR